MEQTKEDEFLLAYETLLATLKECKECKTRSELAIATRELEDFVKEYPELILEYYHKKYNEYNE